MGHERRRIDEGGLAFRVTMSPRPDGAELPTGVLLHDIGMPHRYLTRLHDLLSLATQVVSVDLPGFGGLHKPKTDVDISRMAAARAVASAIFTHLDTRLMAGATASESEGSSAT